MRHEFLQVRIDDSAGAYATLTVCEREILRRIARGLNNLDIGNDLFISEKTVRNHVTKIFEKLGVHSRAQAIVLAKDNGITSTVLSTIDLNPLLSERSQVAGPSTRRSAQSVRSRA